MFGIGTGEILLILVITMLVVGPERMVELAGQIGRQLARFRQETDSMTREFRDALSLELEEGEEAGTAQGAKAAQPAAATGPSASTSSASAPGTPREGTASASNAQPQRSIPLFVEGEIEGPDENRGPYALPASQMENVSPVLVHTAKLIPEERDPEEIDIEYMQPTVVGQPLVVEDAQVTPSSVETKDDNGESVAPESEESADPESVDDETAYAIEAKAKNAQLSEPVEGE